MSLLDPDCVQNKMLFKAKWYESHGARLSPDWFLGGGILYYALAYMTAARMCVCLGSGGGFVPRLMRQAQRDLKIESKTILVDGNMGKWGLPDWFDDRTNFFVSEFPEIEIIRGTTEYASIELSEDRNVRIDYLHVDADHSKEGCLRDLRDYLPMVRQGGMITLHDTDPRRKSFEPNLGVLEAVEEAKMFFKLSIINFPNIGAGIMLMRKD